MPIKNQLIHGENILLYNRNVYECYLNLKDDFHCVYLSEPVPLKFKLKKFIQDIAPHEYSSIKNANIPELRDKILKVAQGEKIVVFFNQFDRLTKNSADIYHSLQVMGQVVYVCSFDSSFKQEIYGFYKTFHFYNKEEYNSKTGKHEINISYAVYAILSMICFIIYIKISATATMSTILLGATWFALIIFRTLIYAGGRI
ncbi:MAG: hypothetical protein ACP5C3_00720 [Methanomicrobiales archaeon]